MRGLLLFSRAVDALNVGVGRATYWLVLAAALVSAGNAISRYALDLSSNGWLELQWYLFSAIFLLAAGYTLQKGEHIKIDIVYGTLSRRRQVWIDIIGTVVFLFPAVILIGWLSIPWLIESLRVNETSSNAGGLLRWPVKILVPVGFGLLFLQGVSELIKRVAFLRGLGPDPVDSKALPAPLLVPSAAPIER